VKLQKPGKIIRLVLIVLFCLILMQLYVSYSFQSDPYKHDVEKFLKDNDRVIEQVGKITELELRKVTAVAGTTSFSSYRKYRFRITGSKGEAFITVKVDLSRDGENATEFSIAPF